MRFGLAGLILRERRLRRLLRIRKTGWRLRGLLLGGGQIGENAHDVAFLHDQQLLPSSLTSLPDHLPNSTRSPTLRSIGMSLPASSRPPGPTERISPCEGFSLALSGMMMPPAVLSSASMRLTTTRSWSGRNFMRSSSLAFVIISGL